MPTRRVKPRDAGGHGTGMFGICPASAITRARDRLGCDSDQCLVVAALDRHGVANVGNNPQCGFHIAVTPLTQQVLLRLSSLWNNHGFFVFRHYRCLQ